VRREVPLGGPVHQHVPYNERRNNVENGLSESSERVEDGGMRGAGEGLLTVGGKGVGGNAFLWEGAC